MEVSWKDNVAIEAVDVLEAPYHELEHTLVFFRDFVWRWRWERGVYTVTQLDTLLFCNILETRQLPEGALQSIFS